MTGEIIELGRDVHFLKKGDIVSVPFNVSCDGAVRPALFEAAPSNQRSLRA